MHASRLAVAVCPREKRASLDIKGAVYLIVRAPTRDGRAGNGAHRGRCI